MPRPDRRDYHDVIYLWLQLGDYRLANIMNVFGLSNVGSVNVITTRIWTRMREDQDFAKTRQ